MESIKVNSVSEAWRTAARIFPTDYEKNEESSKRAGYPIYETTSTDERFSGFHISDLNTRLEVNMGNETVTIWIEEDAFEIVVKGLTEDEKASLKEVVDKEIRKIKLIQKIDATIENVADRVLEHKAFITDNQYTELIKALAALVEARAKISQQRKANHIEQNEKENHPVYEPRYHFPSYCFEQQTEVRMIYPYGQAREGHSRLRSRELGGAKPTHSKKR